MRAGYEGLLRAATTVALTVVLLGLLLVSNIQQSGNDCTLAECGPRPLERAIGVVGVLLAGWLALLSVWTLAQPWRARLPTWLGDVDESWSPGGYLALGSAWLCAAVFVFARYA